MKYLLLLLLLLGCATIDHDHLVEPKPLITSKAIEKIVNESPCTTSIWKGKGVAPKSYILGMATMYAKQLNGDGTDFIKAKTITGKNTLGRSYEDGLKYYGIVGSELNTYTFLIGLGMRESDGRYCVGRDKSQNFIKSDDAESGLFQMAYVARVFNKELAPLYAKYKSGELSCELDIFKSSAIKCTAHDASIFGTGEGAKWQELMKVCPAASTQWAAILIRSQLRHFGPIKRKEVEFKNECREMLKKIEKFKPRIKR